MAFEFVTTQNGKQALVYENHLFYENRSTKDKSAVYYKCSSTSCSTMIHFDTALNQIKPRAIKEHIHLDNHEAAINRLQMHNRATEMIKANPLQKVKQTYLLAAAKIVSGPTPTFASVDHRLVWPKFN